MTYDLEKINAISRSQTSKSRTCFFSYCKGKFVPGILTQRLPLPLGFPWNGCQAKARAKELKIFKSRIELSCH
jgi:hypothetical protein